MSEPAGLRRWYAEGGGAYAAVRRMNWQVQFGRSCDFRE